MLTTLKPADKRIGGVVQKYFRARYVASAKKWFWDAKRASGLGETDEQIGASLGIPRTSASRKTVDFPTWLIGYFNLGFGPYEPFNWQFDVTSAWIDTMIKTTCPHFRAQPVSEDEFYRLCDSATDIERNYSTNVPLDATEKAFVITWLALYEWLP